MSANSKDENTAEELKLVARLQTLRSDVSLRVKSAQRKRTTFIVVGVLLTVACTISLSTVTAMAFKLDAQAIAQIGRLQLEKTIPSGKASLKSYLEQAAPGIVKSFVISLNQTIPELRPVLVGELNKKTGVLTAELEEQLTQQLKANIDATKSDIDREFPQLSEVERLEKLVTSVTRDFNSSMQIAFQGLYPHYASELGKIKDHLDHLRNGSLSELTSEEKTQKDMIQTLLRLIIHEQSETK